VSCDTQSRRRFLFIKLNKNSQNSGYYSAAERGVKRVEIKMQTGKTVGLYEESHALVIGVSDYTNGWPKPL